VQFEFATAVRIVFGSGSVAQLPALARGFGERPLLVTGQRRRFADRMDATVFAVAGEPTVDVVREGARAACEARCDVVIGIGGGSAIDGAKAIAALATNSGDPFDYLEVVGRGKPLEKPPLPFVAVPTTAGTGSEVTRNAVLGSPEHGVKASLRSPLMLAKVALIDPDLAIDLPREITASTGLDALTQLIEPYVSVRRNPMTDMFCVEGMRRAAQALPAAYRDGSDRAARESMSFASLLGGLSLANAGLGVVHGFAAPIGGEFEAAHGAVCAALLAHGIAANIRALRRRDPSGEALRRYTRIATLLTGDESTTAEDGAVWVRNLCRELNIHPLREFGVSTRDAEPLADKAAKASSMKGNPIALTREELIEVVEAAL
jgi:alcohol dehydrogenase class IV